MQGTLQPMCLLGTEVEDGAAARENATSVIDDLVSPLRYQGLQPSAWAHRSVGNGCECC